MKRVPLRELPLEPFLAYEDPIGSKRPHSRATPTPFSPAKRRILSEEGIFVVQKSCKTPFSSTHNSSQSPSRFSQILAGSESPARVLDFGLPKDYGGDPEKPSSSSRMDVDSTPYKAPLSSSRLAASPELKATSRKSARNTEVKDLPQQEANPFETPSAPNKTSSTRRSSKKLNHTTKETLVPRVPPATSAPDSVHYPGFQVYQDPYAIVYAAQDTLESLSEMELDEEMEVNKENIKPRRICVKGATAAVGDGLKSSASKNLKRTSPSPLFTPRKINPPTTPASTKFSRLADKLSLSSVPQTSKKALRQALKDEIDLQANDSD